MKNRAFRNPKYNLRKFRKPTLPCENLAKFKRGCELSSQLKSPFRKPVRNTNGQCKNIELRAHNGHFKAK